MLGGLTILEAEDLIEKKLKEKRFFKDPHVSIFISEHKSRTISVLGYVRNPGTYEILGKMTVINAIALASGLDKDAGESIFLSRTKPDGKKETYVIDLDELFEEKNPNAGIDLMPGDVLYVSQAGSVFIEGAVRQPGSMPYRDELTVSQYITEAGGLASYAEGSDVILIRYKEDGGKTITSLNLNRILDGAEQDPFVKEGDMIIVGSNVFKKFISGLRINAFFFGFDYDPPERERR